tara:strand:- start:154 stop:459 length:306 start_codon:yes stop_codon:yes gene_type:complete
MNIILTPEKNNFLLKNYHLSSKVLLPLAIPSLLLSKYDSKYQNIFHTANIFNLSYHSYVSTSCIITDYIKQPKIEKIVRLVNLKSHSIATLGFLYYIFKNK